MPKQAKEINSFNQGIILNTSEKDIPQDSASFSLNVDPNAKNGILSGIKSNKLLASIDGNISRILYPHTWGITSADLNSQITPNITAETIIVEDASKLSKSFIEIFYKS